MNVIFNSERFGTVVYTDTREQHHSAKCHPRDIRIVNGPNDPVLLEEIAIDIRLGQGESPIGVAKGLLHA